MDHTLDRYHRCGSCGYVIGPSEHTGELVGRCPTYCSTDAVTFTPTEITFPAGPSREAIARDTRDVEALIRDKYRELDQANQANYGETVDAAFAKLARHAGVHLFPSTDQKQATPRDQAAALQLGASYDHSMSIEARPIGVDEVQRRVESTPRVYAESQLAAMSDRDVETLARRMGVEVFPGAPYVNRERIAARSDANHEAWLAKGRQEEADGTLLYRADNDPEWVASWTDEDRAGVGAAAERQSQMDWDVGRERGRRWLDRLGDMSQAERSGIQREADTAQDVERESTARADPDADAADHPEHRSVEAFMDAWADAFTAAEAEGRETELFATVVGAPDPAPTDAHQRGVADGYAGGPYDPGLFADECIDADAHRAEQPPAKWQRVQPDVCNAGDVGGDVQVGEAYNVRWQRMLPDGNTAMITESTYRALNDLNNPDGPTHMERQTEYLVCSDPADPGSTELWSDARYATIHPSANDPVTDPEAVARRAAEVPPNDHVWNTHAPGWAVTGPAETARTADPHEQGVADGYAGGPYNEDLFTDEQHGPAYRAGAGQADDDRDNGHDDADGM